MRLVSVNVTGKWIQSVEMFHAGSFSVAGDSNVTFAKLVPGVARHGMVFFVESRQKGDVAVNPLGKRSMREVDIGEHSECDHQLHGQNPTQQDGLTEHQDGARGERNGEHCRQFFPEIAFWKIAIKKEVPKNHTQWQAPAFLVSESLNIVMLACPAMMAQMRFSHKGKG